MWIHIAIFAALLLVSIGWEKGWIPKEGLGGDKGRRLFVVVVLMGNLTGMALTLKNGQGRMYLDGMRLEKEDVSGEKKLLVSVEGKEAEPLHIWVPEREAQQEEEEIREKPRKKTEEERLLEAVTSYNQQKGDPDYYYLPGEWEGKSLIWKEPKDAAGSLVAALFTAAGAAILLAGAREKEKEMGKRREELLMDYPGLVMKFTLLIQAGLTVRRTFQKMAMDYRRKKPRRPRAAYEELVTACREMERGISEGEAYRRFGERCSQVKYKTFSALLVQNLQRGSRHLGDILEKEALEAWEERKRKARVLGEAAATKLLVPMMLMLVVVMALIMLPACISFYGG